MTGPIFDTHAHYSSRAFDADRFALLDSLPDKGVVGVCEQATTPGMPPGAGAGPPLSVGGGGHWHPSESLLPAADCGVKMALRPRCRYTAATGRPKCAPLPPATTTPRWWPW